MESENNKRLGELIGQLAIGNVSALDEISSLVQGVLMSIGTIYYNNYADLEDSVQDFYLKLFHKASYFRENGNACSWIIKVYANTAKSNIRKKRRENDYLKGIGSCYKTGGNTSEEYLEKHLFLREIFSRLTKEEKYLLVYYYWCKFPVREMAKLLRKPKSTIHNKLKKLEGKVKKFYKK